MKIGAVIRKIKSLCKIKGEDFVHEDHGVIKVYNFRQINRMLIPTPATLLLVGSSQLHFHTA